MAMGAFVAGVMLSESSYRHQLEADIEPFRGVLLGLFFLAVGMSLRLDVVAMHGWAIAGYVAAYMIAKAAVIYAVARATKAPHAEGVERAVLMAQGGEFAFVLYAAAASAGLIDTEQNAIFTAVVVLSMLVTPVVVAMTTLIRRRLSPSTSGYETPEGLGGAALVIGFGRVGQIASQFLFARGYEISIIDTDVEMIDVARDMEFEVYYGDGTRLDILHAAGLGAANVVLVCVDKAEDATRITQLVTAEFPQVPVIVRAVDRRHSIDLVKAGASLQVRETFESAMVLGAAALDRLGVSQAEIAGIEAQLRERDAARSQLELEGGIHAGRVLFHGRGRRAVRATDVTEERDRGG